MPTGAQLKYLGQELLGGPWPTLLNRPWLPIWLLPVIITLSLSGSLLSPTLEPLPSIKTTLTAISSSHETCTVTASVRLAQKKQIHVVVFLQL